MSKDFVPTASVSDVLKGLQSVQGKGAQKAWARPSPPAFCTTSYKPCIEFQNIDAAEGGSDLRNGISEVHLFGVTKSGHSILVRVVGFEHYAYYLAPRGFTKEDLGPLRKYINDLLTEKNEETSLSPISRIDLKEAKGGSSYLKIMVSDYHDLGKVQARMFNSGTCLYRDLFPLPQAPYDGELPCHLRFMLDKEANAMSWLKLAAEKYEIVPTENKISTCQLEVSIHDEHIILSPENQEEMAPLRILSFDIETNIPTNLAFPKARNDSIITIGNTISTYGRANSEVQVVFTLGSCSPINGATVVACEDEAELLLAWKDFVIEADPDIVLGHNIARFDMRYLLGRAIVNNLDKFPYLGRLKASRQVMENPFMDLNTTQFDKCPGYIGRFVLDLFKHVYDLGLAGNGNGKLENLSKKYLGDQKENLAIESIPGLQAGNADDRRTIAVYCLKDTALSLRLIDKMDCLTLQIKAARDAYLPLNAMREKPNMKNILKACRKRKAEMEDVPNTQRTLDSERVLKRQRSDA